MKVNYNGFYMKRVDNKSHCPINFSLEMFGDPWSLLILRDIIYFGKRTYGEFLGSEEAIGTSVLAARLMQLEQRGLITKSACDTDRRKEVYGLTERGLDIIPVMLEMATWGAHHDAETDAPQSWIDLVNADKEHMTVLIRATVRRGGAIFVGPNSVVAQLGLQKP